MSDIEKDIKRCEELIKPEHANWIGISNQEAIRELLNMLKEKDKEIEKKDRQIDCYQNMLATNDMLHIIECEKKDKIIDLMSGYIATLDTEEDICMKNKTNPEWCNEDYTNCKECIKQYFESKAEKE